MAVFHRQIDGGRRKGHNGVEANPATEPPMQLLTFTIANRRYGIETCRVVELLPLVAARPLPRQPAEVLGLIRYRGRFLPAIDLGQLIAGTACRDRLGTRTIVVRLAADGDAGDPPMLALVAEDVIGITSAAGDSPSLPPGDSPFGPVVELAEGQGAKATAQLINVDAALPPAQLQALLGLAGMAVGSPAAADSGTATPPA